MASSAQQAMSDAISALQPHADDPVVDGLISKIRSIRDADRDNRVEKAMVEMDRLRKSEDVSAETRARADAASRALQLEHLAKHNPRGAAEYEQLRKVD